MLRIKLDHGYILMVFFFWRVSFLKQLKKTKNVVPPHFLQAEYGKHHRKQLNNPAPRVPAPELDPAVMLLRSRPEIGRFPNDHH